MTRDSTRISWGRVRAWWYDYEWPVVGLVAVAVAALGAVGFGIHLRATGAPVLLRDVIFRAFQLFLLQTNVEPPMPWQLDLARLAAPVVAGYTALQALAALFAEQLHSFRLRRSRDHVVVCGLGEKGYRLVRHALEAGDRVVVVERDDGNDGLRDCRRDGALIVLGDAAEPEVLGRAGAPRARLVVAVCGDDGTNALVAAAMRNPVFLAPGRAATCLVHVAAPDVWEFLSVRSASPAPGESVRLEYFNIFACGARELLRRFPVPERGPSGEREVVVVGAGPMAEALVVRILSAPSSTAISVLVCAPDAGQRLAAWRSKHSPLPAGDTLRAAEIADDAPEFLSGAFASRAAVVYVCMNDDSQGLSAAIRLHKRLADRDVPVVACLDKEEGLPLLLGAETSAAPACGGLRIFGLLDHACDPSILGIAGREGDKREQRPMGDGASQSRVAR